VTAVKEMVFVDFQPNVFKPKRGIGCQETVLCSTQLGPKLITGTFQGNIIPWNGNTATKPVKAHTGPVNAISTRAKAAGVITGGRDGVVIVWNPQLQQERTINLKDAAINSFTPQVISVCENPSGTKTLIGTRGGEIIEHTNTKSKIHLRSHSSGELWGLACHPNKKHFYTVGQEKMLAIWDIESRRQIKYARLDCAADSLEFSPNGQFLAIGYQSGQLTVVHATTFEMKCVRKDRIKAISETRFNPTS
jgi:WD40 repeat protein